jgi:ATP-binding cassette, subfamily B (MDR/TAP), member 1
VLHGAIKLESEVTQEEIELACRNANILDFINPLPESVLLLGFSSDRFTLL